MAAARIISLMGLAACLSFGSALHAQTDNGQYYYYDNEPYQQGASDEDPYQSTVPQDNGGSAGYENYDNDTGGVDADQLFDSYSH